jgi:hypothetical protein
MKDYPEKKSTLATDPEIYSVLKTVKQFSKRSQKVTAALPTNFLSTAKKHLNSFDIKF